MTVRGSARTVVDDLWSGGRGGILLVISAGQLLTVGVRLIFPALLPQIKTEFLLTNTTAGILLGVLWASFASGQLPGGVLTDWAGERNSLVASALLATVAVLVLVVSPSFALFALGLVLFGFGSGLFATPRIMVLSDIYPERAATAISVQESIGNLGNATLPVVATAVASVFAWRVGIAITVPGFVLLVAGFWVLIPVRTSKGAQRDRDEPWSRTIIEVVVASTRRPVVVATGGMIFVGFVWQGFTSFLPTYLVEVKGIDQSTAAVSLGAFFVAGGILQPIIGSIADRYGERRILTVVMGVAAAALAAFPFVNTPLATVGLAMLASLQLAFWPLIFAYVPRALPDSVQGSGFGLLRTVFLIFGATGPVVVGVLADADLFDGAFFLLAGAIGLAMVLSAGLPRLDR